MNKKCDVVYELKNNIAILSSSNMEVQNSVMSVNFFITN